MIKLLDILKEDNDLIGITKKSDEKFYRKVLNYTVNNYNGNFINSVKDYKYCKHWDCIPIIETGTYSRLTSYFKSEFGIKKVESDILYLLLLFNTDVKDFLTEPLDFGDDYKLYHIYHTAIEIERDVDYVTEECQMCDEGSSNYECGYCHGDGVMTYQDYDTPQECEECRGEGYTIDKCEDCNGKGVVDNEKHLYRLDYIISSFLSKESLNITDDEFSLEEFIELNIDNKIINYKSKEVRSESNEVKVNLDEPGVVHSVKVMDYFDINDLDFITTKWE
jgi:hypothetical protein